jgi:hypothetical protein
MCGRSRRHDGQFRSIRSGTAHFNAGLVIYSYIRAGARESLGLRKAESGNSGKL